MFWLLNLFKSDITNQEQTQASKLAEKYQISLKHFSIQNLIFTSHYYSSFDAKQLPTSEDFKRCLFSIDLISELIKDRIVATSFFKDASVEASWMLCNNTFEKCPEPSWENTPHCDSNFDDTWRNFIQKIQECGKRSIIRKDNYAVTIDTLPGYKENIWYMDDPNNIGVFIRFQNLQTEKETWFSVYPLSKTKNNFDKVMREMSKFLSTLH